MAEQRMIGVRVPPDIEERLKALAERLAAQALPGMRVTLSDVARAALLRGLEVLESDDTRKTRRR